MRHIHLVTDDGLYDRNFSLFNLFLFIFVNDGEFNNY